MFQNIQFFFSKQNITRYASIPTAGIVAGKSILPDASPKAVKRNYPDGLELLSVLIIHRHGSRTPLSTCIEKTFPHFRWDLCRRSGTRLIKKLCEIKAQEKNKGHSQMHPLHEKKYHCTPEFHIRIVGETAGKQIELSAGNTRPKQVEFDHLAPEDSCYLGQLTDVGHELMTSLGRRLRELYVDRLGFLPATFDPKTVNLRSTEYARTIESLQAVFTGLYPGTKEKPEVFIKKHEEETMYASEKCVKYKKTFEKHQKSTTEKHSRDIKRFKDRIGASLGIEAVHGTVERLWDALFCRYTHNQPLPMGISALLLKQMEQIALDIAFGHVKPGNKAFHLGSGAFLREITTEICKAAWAKTLRNEVASIQNTPRLSVFSGHDSTITPLVLGLGIPENGWPCFGANITFEVFKEITGGFYVRTKYNDMLVSLPAANGWEHRTDKTLCRLERFLEICGVPAPEWLIDTM
eukprot:GHVN01002597.1.p1 GENE.GHVN01002597.1~~GHVN01002597.1.p1  ORF type:complete len:475 (+),score=37.63 GHVN01002597.1:34-1425(+)